MMAHTTMTEVLPQEIAAGRPTPSAMERALQRRRDAVAAMWALRDEIVLIGAGEPVPIPGRGDQVYPFRAHTEYFYLTDRDEPGAVLTFDPHAGWTHFGPDVTADDQLWSGASPAENPTRSMLGAWLDLRRGRPVVVLGAPVGEASSDMTRQGDLRQALVVVRRPKDDVEIGRMRAAAAATRAAYETVRPLIRAGASERLLQIEIDAAFCRHGGDRPAYDTIIAGGPNAAVLHFTPTARVLQEGELVLIDAGAEFQNYACDVTRTYPVSERLSPEQADLYAIVKGAERRAIDRCRAGVEYRDIHLAAATNIARGLVDIGLLRGDPEGLVESGACALFFPHGIGHMVGLGVRDVSGYLPGRTRGTHPALRFLRVDLPLQERYALTIEPGIYFLEHALADPENRRVHRDAVNWDAVDRWRGCGGIRIEDNVLVGADGPTILTSAIPIEY
jgi:Xaa-Pro aminopeptidase